MRLRIFDHEPAVHEEAWVAPNATLIGEVEVHARASIFYGAVVRADRDRIVVGERSNLQDSVTVHGDPGSPTIIGRGVSVGHAAVLHGCTIEDDCLIGMSATILNGAVIGRHSLVAAGSVVLEGTVVPPRSLVAGVPGQVRRQLTDDEIAHITQNAETYVQLSREHAAIND
jgi:carbonic anhydrase/acetyltransferase-like protein (isoleucine patch superfamily)